MNYKILVTIMLIMCSCNKHKKNTNPLLTPPNFHVVPNLNKIEKAPKSTINKDDLDELKELLL